MKKINRFDRRIENISSDIWSKITQIDKLQGQWISGAKLGSQVLGRLKKSVLISSTGASTRIEGAKLSDEEVEKMMSGISTTKLIDRDEQEVGGYYELLENIFNSWKKLQFNESAIKGFHNELLKYSEKDQEHRGDYKNRDNKVHILDGDGKSLGILFDTVPAYLTPKRMQEVIEWTQKAFKETKFHPLLIISNFLVEFLKIHPFIDGNGRLSRVLTNLLLLKEGYEYVLYVSHEKFVEDNKSDYYIALRRSQKTIDTKKEDIIPWLDFFLTIFREQSEMAVGLLAEENIDKLMTDKQIAVWRYIEGVKRASPMEISKAVNIAQPTVRQVLQKLMRLKKIERVGQGRSTKYRKL